jgi:methionine-gamma-lyase
METKNLGFDSKLIHAGDIDDAYGSAVTPIYQTSTFSFKNSQQGADLFAGKEKGYIYTRMGNPTIDALENKLAELENGYKGIALSSGMAAVSNVYMTVLSSGSHMISTGAVYGPSRCLMESLFSKFGVESTYMDTSNIDELESNIRPNTKLLYIESPANPTISLTDIQKAFLFLQPCLEVERLLSNRLLCQTQNPQRVCRLCVPRTPVGFSANRNQMDGATSNT